MPYFPFFSDISGKRVLIIGGARRALAKVKRLLPFCAEVHVIYPEIDAKICAILGDRAECREVNPADFEPTPLFVVCASESAEENGEFARYCRSRNIPVNAVDYPEYCDFIFPALITNGSLSIGISTGGACPAVTTALKKSIEELLPEHFSDILVSLEARVPELRKQIQEEHKRGDAVRALFAESIRLDRPLTNEESEAILLPFLDGGTACD